MHLFNFHISGQDAVVSHFDFDTYPDLNSVLSAEPAQPKLTGAASVIRYSILFSDLVCSIARVSTEYHRCHHHRYEHNPHVLGVIFTRLNGSNFFQIFHA